MELYHAMYHAMYHEKKYYVITKINNEYPEDLQYIFHIYMNPDFPDTFNMFITLQQKLYNIILSFINSNYIIVRVIHNDSIIFNSKYNFKNIQVYSLTPSTHIYFHKFFENIF